MGGKKKKRFCLNYGAMCHLNQAGDLATCRTSPFDLKPKHQSGRNNLGLTIDVCFNVKNVAFSGRIKDSSVLRDVREASAAQRVVSAPPGNAAEAARGGPHRTEGTVQQDVRLLGPGGLGG